MRTDVQFGQHSGVQVAELRDHYQSYYRMSKADAHAAAQAVRAGGDPEEKLYAHPYYWAAFTFNGV